MLFIFFNFVLHSFLKTIVSSDHVINPITPKLHQDLLKNEGYISALRPELYPSVKISFTLFSINDFDEIKGSLSVVGIINLQWMDFRLKWKRSAYDGVSFFCCYLRDIWRPSISLLNSENNFRILGREAEYTTAWIMYTGKVFYAFGGVFRTSCDPNVFYFPFDVHECYLLFIPFDLIMFGTLNDSLAIIDPLFPSDANITDEDGKWIYKSLDPCIRPVGNTRFNGVYFPIRLQRRWEFVFINIIMPIIFLNILNIFVFLIPIETGERISFSITVLLSYTVFMTVIASSIPETSRPMPLISYFLTFKLAFSLCIVIAVIFVSRMFLKDTATEVPSFLKRLIVVTEKIEKRFRCNFRKSIEHHDISEYAPGDCDSRGECSNKVTFHRSTEDLPTPRDKSYDNNIINWQRVSKAVDKLLFISFMSVTILDMLIFSIVMTNYKDKLLTGTKSVICQEM